MPESFKLLALQDSLHENIEKRVAHVFTCSGTFHAAWSALETKYASPGLIIKAHDIHLQHLQSFKSNDFADLFNMTAAVSDAIASVHAT